MMGKPFDFSKIFPNYFLIIILFFSGFGFESLIGQNENSQTIIKNEADFLVGSVNRSELQKGDFGIHFLREYQEYIPDQETQIQLRQLIYDCKIIIVLGTWCSDSQQQVPRFYKLLDELQYATQFVTNICVDKNKEAGDLSLDNLNIERVPTFIFYKDDKEIGRIIETPNESLERDTYSIVNSR